MVVLMAHDVGDSSEYVLLHFPSIKLVRARTLQSTINNLALIGKVENILIPF